MYGPAQLVTVSGLARPSTVLLRAVPAGKSGGLGLALRFSARCPSPVLAREGSRLGPSLVWPKPGLGQCSAQPKPVEKPSSPFLL
ncbi:hypothetical protein L484_011290 [Morus notabilis]|uniref:Uncharacterized protein n=1 Tax=Morus notabilis TaxID=981085 RepID=W9RSC5_9ROSA|nr:hypothetical protein L484_011290 [Morus notabilis]